MKNQDVRVIFSAFLNILKTRSIYSRVSKRPSCISKKGCTTNANNSKINALKTPHTIQLKRRVAATFCRLSRFELLDENK